MGLWEGTKSPLTLGPRYIPTPAPDLIGAIGTAVAIALGPDILRVQYVFSVASAMSKMTLLLDIGVGRINWAYRKLQSRI